MRPHAGFLHIGNHSAVIRGDSSLEQAWFLDSPPLCYLDIGKRRFEHCERNTKSLLTGSALATLDLSHLATWRQ